MRWSFEVETAGDRAYVHEYEKGKLTVVTWGPMPTYLTRPFIHGRMEILAASTREATENAIATWEAREHEKIRRLDVAQRREALNA